MPIRTNEPETSVRVQIEQRQSPNLFLMYTNGTVQPNLKDPLGGKSGFTFFMSPIKIKVHLTSFLCESYYPGACR